MYIQVENVQLELTQTRARGEETNAKSANGFQPDGVYGVRLIHLEVLFTECNEIMKRLSR